MLLPTYASRIQIHVHKIKFLLRNLKSTAVRHYDDIILFSERCVSNYKLALLRTNNTVIPNLKVFICYLNPTNLQIWQTFSFTDSA